jgi:hypothetical protein
MAGLPLGKLFGKSAEGLFGSVPSAIRLGGGKWWEKMLTG